MKQQRINLTLTRHDAATVMVIISQALGEPGMLEDEDREIAARIENRIYRLLRKPQRRISIFSTDKK